MSMMALLESYQGQLPVEFVERMQTAIEEELHNGAEDIDEICVLRAFQDALGRMFTRGGLMSGLPEWLGPKFADRSAELNNYFGPKCKIGFHGDAERKIVFCVRLGQPRPLYFQAFDKSGFPIGNRITVQLSHGDGYLMSDQAVGYNWLDRANRWRHAAGCIDTNDVLIRKKKLDNLRKEKRKQQHAKTICKKQKFLDDFFNL